ncbi:MAG: cupin domain-containing protein [Exilispira sp.]
MEIDFSKPTDLSTIGDYQKGAIVSSSILNKKSGNVTFFAFDEGQSISEHTAPYDAMVYIIEGEAQIMISNKYNLLKAGQMIIMPANKPHSLNAVKSFKMLLIMILSH